MNRKKHRLLPAIAPMLLALSFLTSGCVEPLDPSLRGSTDPNAVSLPIRLYIPGAMPATKAGSGDVAGVSPESQVYRVQVWMFDHQAADERTGDTKTAVAYAEADLTGNSENMGQYDQSGYYATWESDKIFRLPLMIPGYVLERSADNMKFDFYVLANAPSIGSPADRTTTRGALKALTFGGDWFGTTTPKTGTTPAIAINGSEDAKGPGLPISGFFNKTKDTGSSAESPYVGPANGVDLSFLKTQPNITEAEMRKLVPVVQLERAVSKIRFAFVRPKGMAGVQITKIVIDEKLIPDNTFVFPREDGTDGTSDYSYNTAATTIQGSLNGNTRLPLLADTDIKEMTDAVPDPKSLESTSGTAVPGYSVNVAPKNMSAQQYSDLLNAFATSQLVYLRESGKKIKGKIYYKLSADGDEKSAVFEMDADDDDTNFYRNHSWIVYAYFKGDGLFIKPVLVKDWDYTASNQHYNYLQTGEAHIIFSDKSQSLFGYGWTTANENTWYDPAATPAQKTEWYFRRQSWNSTDHELDYTQPGQATYYPWSDWVNSQMVVASGINSANVPIFSNRIELETSLFTGPLRLVLTNTTDFFIVIYHTDPDMDAYEVVSTSYAEIPYSVAHNGGRTYFYVVPKEGNEHIGKTTGVYLVTTGTNPEKIPFNSNAFPGARDYTEVYFYSVDPDDFKGYYTNQPPVNIKPYNKNGELTI